MPIKELITGDLENEEGVCALGCLAQRKQIKDIEDIDPTDHNYLAGLFDIATCLVQEIEFENDEGVYSSETPEQRWIRMRKWVDRNLKSP